jgi:hypothetical protein
VRERIGSHAHCPLSRRVRRGFALVLLICPDTPPTPSVRALAPVPVVFRLNLRQARPIPPRRDDGGLRRATVDGCPLNALNDSIAPALSLSPADWADMADSVQVSGIRHAARRCNLALADLQEKHGYLQAFLLWSTPKRCNASNVSGVCQYGSFRLSASSLLSARCTESASGIRCSARASRRSRR